MRADGSRVEVIRFRPEWSLLNSVAWSPDGRRLLVNQAGIVFAINQDGTDRRVVTLDAERTRADWQPQCTLMGSDQPEVLRGTEGDDLVCGLGGADTITGGPGSDRLFGEEGEDSFFARDGEFDVVGCGAGRDTVVADRRDLVGTDCERVSRGAA
jgi:Ca2+-binding RTX toxin-like protein